jgi:hypothetical protein
MKTLDFIKENQNRKIGLLLPTAKQYENMNRVDRMRWSRTIQSYDKSFNKVEPFQKLLKLDAGLTGSRLEKKQNARHNVNTYRQAMGSGFDKPTMPGKSGSDIQPRKSSSLYKGWEIETFNELSDKDLKSSAREVEKRMTNFEYGSEREQEHNTIALFDVETGDFIVRGSKSQLREYMFKGIPENVTTDKQVENLRKALRKSQSMRNADRHAKAVNVNDIKGQLNR